MNPNTLPCGLSSIKAAMRKFAAIPKPDFDCIVTTTDIEQMLRDYVTAIRAGPQKPQALDSLTMDGMEVLAYPDETTATCATIAMRCEGKSPMLILGEEGKK